MREARLILPSGPNLHIQSQLEAKLVSTFGGYTTFAGRGGWDYAATVAHEPVDVYDIAMADCGANMLSLDRIVDWLFTVTDERAIYLRYPDGDVLIRGRPLETPAAVAI